MRRIFLLILSGYIISSAKYIPAAQPLPAANRIASVRLEYIAAPESNPLQMPTDIAVNDLGQIFVADGVGNRIACFDKNGVFNKELTRKISRYKLNQPIGVATDRSNRLWIADTGNHRLLVCASDGFLLRSVPLPGAQNPIPTNPTDVVVTAREVYVVDNNHHQILIWDLASNKWTSKGRPGLALGQFQWPFMICTGADNYIYITEALGARVQIISPEERWAGQIGRWGISLGHFYRPKGISADAQGQIYVSDSTLGVIQVFGPWGAIRAVVTDDKGEMLRFRHPMGMCFDRDNRLYVVELGKNRIVRIVLEPSPSGGANETVQNMRARKIRK